ncbi:MAG: zinc-binding dehydrogenase [Nitrososphaerales archaeon]|nr:zinc-binding dehydrogenase [Nitrososphaerales archaeon]
MKAVRFESPGGPEVLKYGDAPTPSTSEGEVLVKVAACGVNRIDIWLRSGRYKTYVPHILGADVCGEVASAPPRATELKVGQRAVVYPSLSDWSCRYCLAGYPNRCVSGGLLGAVADGGYADYVKVPARNLVDAGSLDPKLAAAVPVNFATAWSAFAERACVRPGDTILVWGAAGGVGHAAVQVAKLLGAQVIGVAGGKEKRTFVIDNGADHFIDHTTEDVPARAKEITGGHGVDYVFDDVGGDTWEKSLESLAKGGTVLSVALTSGAASTVDVGRLYRNELNIVGVFAFRREALVRVLRLVAEERLKPRIFRELPLKSAKQAHEILESRKIEGKILLVP